MLSRSTATSLVALSRRVVQVIRGNRVPRSSELFRQFEAVVAKAEREMMARSWKVEVQTTDTPYWISNALRFPDKESAERYGRDLSYRWTAVTKWQAVESDEEATEPPAA